MWQATVLTLFPEMFPGTLGQSLAGRALEKGLWGLETLNFRDFALDKHKTVDDTPFGGGAGMVIRADVLDQALSSIPDLDQGPVIYLTPRGQPLQQSMVKKFVKSSKITLICGRYEGIDERLLQVRDIQEVSIGDFVLSGGELAAMVLIDACVRLLPGVMGAQESMEEESFQDGLLEYPHYTRPQVWQEIPVPEVLLSGHHENIRKWRRQEAEKLTKDRRPDLWAKYKSLKGEVAGK
jgi:tRNA (guanine37-N1)-methyltransferase